MGRHLRYLLPLVIFGVLAGFFYKGLDLNPTELDSPLIGKAAPSFTLPNLHEPDQSMSPDDLRGQPWLLNVWASWCVSCRQEHPLFMELARRGDVPIYGLNYKDERPDALAWLRQFGDPYSASVSDYEGRVGIDYGVYGVPETYVIDGRGIIRYKHVGPVTPTVLTNEILPMIEELRG